MQFADPGHEPLTILVLLADHEPGFAARIVVKIFLELTLDNAALFFDNQHFVLVVYEVECTVWL